MIPFSIDLKPGSPFCDQLAYAVKKAIVSGQLQTGDRLPSVRVLAQELKINPNTVQKAISRLTAEGLLEIQPGIGCSIANRPRKAEAKACAVLLHQEMERLVVEARRLNLSKEEVEKALTEHWNRISGQN
ncbi:MAG: GntR family transcriptional regulator [Victivallales bacterium]|nr:GntR family transcriptional regulator [Victivallales bacterium]